MNAAEKAGRWVQGTQIDELAGEEDVEDMLEVCKFSTNIRYMSRSGLFSRSEQSLAVCHMPKLRLCFGLSVT